jgi:predicted methyltransferase
MFKALYTSLKPGGVLGVTDHRLPESMPQDAKATSGYMHESYVIKMAEAPASSWPRNPRSTPIRRTRPTTRAACGRCRRPWPTRTKTAKKYQAIGESDRMTLKFVKP